MKSTESFRPSGTSRAAVSSCAGRSPRAGSSLVDPFLLIDEMGPVDYAPGEAVGAPDHPHRGFETVTYMLEGEFEHEDSAGHKRRAQARATCSG